MKRFRRIRVIFSVLTLLFLNSKCLAGDVHRPGISVGTAWCKVDDPDGFAKLFIDKYGHQSYYLKLAWSTHPGGKYDVYRNPNEFLIGAPLSVYMSFGPQVKFRPSENVEIILNGSWFHHSSGNMSQPNYGLNDFMAGVDLRFNIDAPYTQQVRGLSLPHSFPKGFKFDVYGTFGLHACKTELKAYNMMEEDPDRKLAQVPARPRMGIALDAAYRYCQLCTTGLVMDFGCHWDSPMLRGSDAIIYGEKAVDDGPGYSPFSWALGFIHEFHYGNFSAFCGCSRYLFRKVGINEDHAKFFQRAGMRFYFPRIANTFLGLCIRATKFNNADFFEFQMGVRI